MESGRFINQQDINIIAKVCVLGQTVVTNLFGTLDPIDKWIRVNNIPFKVVGVLSAKGQSPTGQDQDDVVLMPYTTVQRKIMGVTYIGVTLASSVSAEARFEAIEQITSLLRQRHRLRPNEENDFTVISQVEFASTIMETSHTMTVLLGSIASYPDCRRHRHHEYHAGLYNRKDKGDRLSDGSRRQGKGYPFPVPDGSDGFKLHWRDSRSNFRRCPVKN